MNVLIPRGSPLGKHATEEGAQEVLRQITAGTIWCLFEAHAADPFTFLLIEEPEWRPAMRKDAKLLAYSNRPYRFAIIFGVQKYANGTFQLRSKFVDQAFSRSGTPKEVGGTAFAFREQAVYARSRTVRGDVAK